MPWVNFHSHSLFSDGKATPEEFIKTAISRNFPAYGFSCHSPVPFQTIWNMDAGILGDYLDEIARIRLAYQEEIEVYCGLELDYINGIPHLPVTALKQMGCDYIIGSVHFIDQYPDGTWFCFDGKPDIFFRGIEIIYQNDFKKAVTAYYEKTRMMVDRDCPDIIGHMDKIKMHNSVRHYLDEEEEWYRKQVDETLDLIAEKGCIIEVSSRGLYKHNPPLLYPDARVIKQAFLRKIPVMLNSDSHHPDEIDCCFNEAALILKQTGYKTLRVLHRGSWQDMPFNETGILY
jgi:histidinol-phosphatase (PHP family)